MKVTGISGSRRKKGNTALLIEEALKPFREAGAETEIIFLGDYQITPCSGGRKQKRAFKGGKSRAKAFKNY